jgi:uncharacterized protein
MIEFLFVTVGLLLVIEGVLYAAFPGPMKRMIATMLAQTDDQLRYVGLIALAAGVVTVWLAQSSGH